MARVPNEPAAYEQTVAAYQGVEDLDRFTPEELSAYREGLLDRTAHQVAFLEARMQRRSRALEVACGNGRLLLGLARSGTIAEGVGTDVAESRIDFARAWTEDEQAGDTLQFHVADALREELPAEPFDAALLITGALGYFEPMRAGSTADVLAAMRRALRPDGLLVLELYPHPRWRRMLDVTGGELRLWSELPGDDPWRFYLSHLTLDDAGNLRHDKTFVHRTDGRIDDSRSEFLRLWSEPELRGLLQATGFGDVAAFGDWAGRPYREGEDELLIVTASA
ncbi:MAG: hypothetical protein QOI64_1601 [Solirubrobacteraceae bacterium]|nr:hypothetical protein [Solirubrobacteraceae bacterium]